MLWLGNFAKECKSTWGLDWICSKISDSGHKLTSKNQIKTNCLPTVLKHIPEAPVSIGKTWTKTTLPARKIASENAGFWNLSGAWHTITGKYRFNRSVYEQRQGQTWCALFLPGVFNLFSLRERWLLKFYFPFSFFFFFFAFWFFICSHLLINAI